MASRKVTKENLREALDALSSSRDFLQASTSTSQLFSNNFPKKKNRKKPVQFSRNIILLKTRRPLIPYLEAGKTEWGKKGYVCEGVKLDKNYSYEELVNRIENLEQFKKKLRSNDVTFFQKSGKELRPFFVNPQTDKDGEFIASHTRKDIYVQPYTDILDWPASDSDTGDSVDHEENEENKCVEVAKINEPDSVVVKERLREVLLASKNSSPPHLGDPYEINVDRKAGALSALFTALSDPTFSVDKRLRVTFKNEAGVGQGLVKELFTLALREIKNHELLEGNDFMKTFIYQKRAKVFENFGIICALSLMHGGPAPSFFTPLICAQIFGDEYKPTVSGVMNSNHRAEIEAVIQATSQADINKAMANTSIFQFAGTYVQVEGDQFETQRSIAVQDALDYLCILRLADAISSFSKGLNSLNLITSIKATPDKMLLARTLLCHSQQQLTANNVLEVFKMDDDTIQSLSFGFFKEYLERSEKNRVRHPLSEILKFATGLDDIPPLGFEPPHSVRFDQSSPTKCKKKGR